MDKPFFIGLIAILSFAVYSILGLFNEYSDFGTTDLGMIFPEFIVYDLMFIIISFCVSGLFFLYRYKQIFVFPLLCSLIQCFYIFIIWRFCVRYCTDPVGYIAKKNGLWSFKEFEHFKLDLKETYDCCGFSANDTKSEECVKKNVWSCSCAVALHKGKVLREKVWGEFTKSFLHIAASFAFWSTHLTGGIEEDFFDKNKKRPTAEYTKV